MKKSLILLVLFLCSFVSIGRAEPTPEKRKEIEKMLQLTGVEKLMGQMMHQMLTNFKRQMPKVPADYWDRLEQKMDTHELIEKIIPVYDKYYSIDDLKAVNAFYGSPAGQKILGTLPQVMQESMEIGRQWGEKIGKEVAAEVEREKNQQQ